MRKMTAAKVRPQTLGAEEMRKMVAAKVRPQSLGGEEMRKMVAAKVRPQSLHEEGFVENSVTKQECRTEPERTIITTMLFSPDQKISDGILYLRRFFQNILQDSNDKENRISPETTRRASTRKRTRGGNKVNYAVLVGKRRIKVDEEKSQEDICLNNVYNVTSCVHRRQNMIKESSLPVPSATTHTTRHSSKPDPTVYDFPKQWNPDHKTGSLSLYSSAMEIEGATVPLDPAQLRDYHYAELLETPVSHRNGRTETQKYFSCCLSTEKMRSTCIAEVAQRLKQHSSKATEGGKRTLWNVEADSQGHTDTRSRKQTLWNVEADSQRHTDTGSRKRTLWNMEAEKQGHTDTRSVDTEAVLKDAEKVVDDMMYLRELLEAAESSNNQVQVMKRSFEERGLGSAPDLSDPLTLALEMKSRLAKQSPNIITDEDIYTKLDQSYL